MNNRETILAVLILIIAVALGYYLMEDQGRVPNNEPEARPVAVEETIEFVSILDKIHPDKIKVVSTHEVEWPDGCLGLARPYEVCAQMIVEGYKITLDADGKLMIFRTNKDGSSIRRDILAENKR